MLSPKHTVYVLDVNTFAGFQFLYCLFFTLAGCGDSPSDGVSC